METEGSVFGLKAGIIKVSLPSLGYMMQAEVENENLKVITPLISCSYEMMTQQYAISPAK